MTYIIYNSDRTIKTYLERIDDVVLQDGETFKKIDQEFEEYASRFVISCEGQTCLAIRRKVGADPVVIEISAPGYTEVSISVAGSPQSVTLTEGKGSISLPTDSPGRYAIEPADRTLFCAAGNGSLLVVVENEV